MFVLYVIQCMGGWSVRLSTSVSSVIFVSNDILKILFLCRTFDSDINASYIFPPITFFVRRLDVDGSLSSKATDDPISGKEEKRPNDLR